MSSWILSKGTPPPQRWWSQCQGLEDWEGGWDGMVGKGMDDMDVGLGCGSMWQIFSFPSRMWTK